MTRRQFQRSPAEYSAGAARTPWLPHRMRDAAAFARRWARRKEDGATDTVPAIEDQLQALQPICSAQRVPTGITCGAPAVAVAEIHAIDGCDQMGLSPDGDLVETLCQACLATVQSAMATYVGDKREMASRRGTRPVCTTCGRPTGYLRSVLRCAPDRARGAGIMTRLRIASLFVAVVAGDYAALMLIDGQLIDFGVTAAICAGSFGAAGLIAYADRRRRTALARGRAAVWERRDQQAAAADEQCPLCMGARQKPSDSAKSTCSNSPRR